MALINCPECGKQVSDSAPSCPHCGYLLIEKYKNKDHWLFIIGLISVIIIVGLWSLNFYLLNDIGEVNRGTFGDMFGSVNALFSGLAFAGIIITILLQRKELALQRNELVETRHVLKRTADAQEKSEEAMIRQADNLKISAKLSALNALINHYNAMRLYYHEIGNATEMIKYERKRNVCIKEIERINIRKDIK
jgi:uncharacterized membrane protein